MSPHHESVIFSPTRPKDPKTPTLIFTAHDGTISEMPQTPQMTTTSFTFPDTVALTAEQPPEHSPTLLNNMNMASLVKQRHKKNGMEPLPEEIPMLSSTNNNHLTEDAARTTFDNREQQKEQHRQQCPDEVNNGNNCNLLSQNSVTRKPNFNKVITPIPSPRNHIIDTRMTTDDNNYVNTKQCGQFLVNNSNSKMAEAFSNPSYQILNKTVPPHHNHHNSNN